MIFLLFSVGKNRASFMLFGVKEIAIVIVLALNYLFILLVMCVLYASVIPMTGGFYDLWPSSAWDWIFAGLSLAFCLFAINRDNCDPKVT